LAVFRIGGYSAVKVVKGCSIKIDNCFIRVGDCFITVGDCSIRVGDCSIRIYQSISPFYACTVSAMHQNNFWISEQEKVVI